MISISSIQEYMYCPLKLYLRYNLNEVEDSDILLNRTIKQIRIDLQDLLHRNIRGLKKDMELDEVKKYLNRNIKETINNSFEMLYERNNLLQEEIDKIKNEVMNEILFDINLISLKSIKAMKSLKKDGQQIAEMFFPSSMYSYLIRDNNLEIMGTCDKIEIIEGRYYPIDLKTGNPPIQGVWDGDSIKLVANAMLIEQEFDTEVFVGFIDYIKIGERRPVVMDSKLRKELFKVIHEVKEVIEEGIIPEVTVNKQKCSNCGYLEICHQNEEINEEIK
jgi:CRISPR-associated exonuclease Cas4